MIEALVAVGIIILLVLANGLFVAAEFAIVGAPRASIEHRASQGSRLAQRVARILESPRRQDRYIATTQIGISIASLGLGMYGEHVVAEWIAASLSGFGENRWIAAHTMASIAALTMLTYLHIVLGEMIPKALALQRADRTALYVSPVILLLERAILPLVVTLNAVGNAILRMIGVRRQEMDTERYHTTAELQFIVKESHESGMLRGEAGGILRELFEFGDLTAGEVMVPRVHILGIAAGSSSGELRRLIRATPHTRFPVHDGDLDHIIGSVHIKDLLKHLVSDTSVTAADARPLPYVPTTAAPDQVLAAMRRFRSQMAVVMDEQGGTAGLITIEDLFEEVVGEIEEGRGSGPLVVGADGRLKAHGTVRLADAGEALGVSLDHPDVQSVSGLVLTLLGRPPLVGDSVVWKGVRIEVVAVIGHGVGDAILQRIPSGARDSSA
jgi:CBS domain containing-hemolysin-like protein